MTDDNFAIDAQLLSDSQHLSSLKLCDVLLVKDANYPWLILVPRRVGAEELLDLTEHDRKCLMEEIALACEILRNKTNCDKLNVAALGNQVRQLHVHIIARFKTDAAWAGPVWGVAPRKEYKLDELADFAIRLRQDFGC